MSNTSSPGRAVRPIPRTTMPKSRHERPIARPIGPTPTTSTCCPESRSESCGTHAAER